MICNRHWGLRQIYNDRSHTQDRRCELLQAVDSASYDIAHETGGTICYGQWVLRRYEFLRVLWVLGSACFDITYETVGTICYGLLFLRLVISYKRKGSACYDITHETGHDL